MLSVNLGHTGMRFIVGAKDMFGFVFLVVSVFFFHGHGAHELAAFIVDQRDFAALGDGIGLLFGNGEGDGDRPQGAVSHQHVGHHGLVIFLAHKTIQRTERAHAEHDQIGCFARGKTNLR